MRFFLTTLLLLGFSAIVSAQSYTQRFNTLDIQHYKLSIEVNDTTNIINATAVVSIKFKKIVNDFELDLIAIDSITKMGMKVDTVYQNKILTDFSQTENKLRIKTKHVFPKI